MQTKINRRIPGRSLLIISVCMTLWAVLIIRLFYLQVIKYDEYQSKVIDNVQKETTVSAERGTIYDSDMVALATNITTWRVFIAPNKIEDSTQANLIAANLSEILGVDAQSISEKAAKTHRADETVKKNIDEDAYNKVIAFIEEYELYDQIHLEASTMRYYPYGALASNVIGFCGTDGGLIGLEYQYDDELTGVEGKYITAQDASGKNMPYKYDSYIDAEDGGNVVTTIKTKIQSVLEEQLEATYNDSDPLSRVCGIVMNPNTGAVYAMGTYPTMDLNDPYTLDADSQAKLDESGFAEGSTEYNELYWELVYGLWKNKAVSELYEPGSTFKVITTAMALEENAVTFNDSFYCAYDNFYVDGYSQPIRCHKKTGHGLIPYSEGLQQSCNVALMNVAFRLGNETFYDYFKRFGYTERTNIDLPGEESPIYTEYSGFNQVELAVYSFGQTFKVTPISQLRAICAVANGGYLVIPHVVDSIVDDDGNLLYSFENDTLRQVVSTEVCEEISEVLEDGVSGDGGAKNAYVAGYKIAAKTGTSQKRDILDADYVVGSTVAYAPSDDPQVAVLIMVDTPTCANQYGSVVAAPYVANVLEEVLPLLGVERSYNEGETDFITTALSDYTGKSIEAAAAAITSKGLKYEVIGDGETVNSQLPAAGSTLMLESGKVVLYTGSETPENNLVTVPDLTDYGAETANAKLISLGFNVAIDGLLENTAKVTGQDPEPGTALPEGSLITIKVRSLSGTE